MFTTRIYYQDTDAGAIVYYANYLKFVEKSWFEYLLSIGLSIPRWQAMGVYIIVRKASLDLIEPVRYADLITVQTEIREVKNAYFMLSHVICKDDGEITTRCETKMVCVDNKGKPKRMPDEFRSVLLQNAKME